MTPSLLDHRIISGRYFFPQDVYFDNPFWVECSGARLSCYYHKPYNDALTVVAFHGNGETVADYLELYAPLFEKLGCNCFLAEYRGYGMSTGVPGLCSMLDDVNFVMRATGELSEKLVVFGRSVGSIYALHAVSQFPATAGLIIESGIADVLERLLLRVNPGEIGATVARFEEAVSEKLDHRSKIENYRGPSLIMHALNDSLVDHTHGKRLYQWAQEPKYLNIFDRGDHNDIFYENMQVYVAGIHRFLEEIRARRR